jgi:PAS domain S-box-containing protein
MALVAPDGRFLQVNASLCELTGYPAEELVTKTFQEITHPDDLELDLDYVRQMLAGEIRTYQMEKRYFHRLGDVVWILLSVSLVRTSDGEPLYFISQIQDITESKRALEALAQTMELRTTFEWRGLGFISQSALKLRSEFADFDAERRYDVPGVRVADPKACQCGEVLKGVIKPWQCRVFGSACTPETPIGSCMVSPEGACAAYYNYGRYSLMTRGRSVT